MQELLNSMSLQNPAPQAANAAPNLQALLAQFGQQQHQQHVNQQSGQYGLDGLYGNNEQDRKRSWEGSGGGPDQEGAFKRQKASFNKVKKGNKDHVWGPYRDARRPY